MVIPTGTNQDLTTGGLMAAKKKTAKKKTAKKKTTKRKTAKKKK